MCRVPPPHARVTHAEAGAALQLQGLCSASAPASSCRCLHGAHGRERAVGHDSRGPWPPAPRSAVRAKLLRAADPRGSVTWRARPPRGEAGSPAGSPQRVSCCAGGTRTHTAHAPRAGGRPAAADRARTDGRRRRVGFLLQASGHHHSRHRRPGLKVGWDQTTSRRVVALYGVPYRQAYQGGSTTHPPRSTGLPARLAGRMFLRSFHLGRGTDKW